MNNFALIKRVTLRNRNLKQKTLKFFWI